MSVQVFNKNLVPSTVFTASKSFPVVLNGLDLLAVQPIYTVSTPSAAVMASASAVTAAVQASQTFTVVDYTQLTGKTITINGTVFTEGTDWHAATDNNTTATSIAGLTPTGITGAAASAVVTFTNTAYGTVGNANTIATNAPAGGATLGGATFTGGIDAKFHKVAHGLTTGVVGQMTTSSALPTGLATTTNYYVIVIDADNFALASSLANALAGTRIEWTSTGTGNQTFTPTTASFAIKLQAGNDGKTWTDISGDSVTIAASGSALWTLQNPAYAWLNIVVTATAGVMTLNVLGNGVRQGWNK